MNWFKYVDTCTCLCLLFQVSVSCIRAFHCATIYICYCILLLCCRFRTDIYPCIFSSCSGSEQNLQRISLSVNIHIHCPYTTVTHHLGRHATQMGRGRYQYCMRRTCWRGIHAELSRKSLQPRAMQKVVSGLSRVSEHHVLQKWMVQSLQHAVHLHKDK